MDYSTIGWILIALIWASIAAYVFWMIGPVWKDKLLRCPDTGAVALVGIRQVMRAGKAPAIEVDRCGLWPEKQGCDRGCLSQFGETSPGLRVDGRGLGLKA
jgi:hypothetical protein